MIQFFLCMVPPTVTHQEKKIHVVNGKPYMYEPQELKNARNKLRTMLAVHRPPEPLAGPVELVSTWCFPVSGNHKIGEHKTSKPDVSRLLER